MSTYASSRHRTQYAPDTFRRRRKVSGVDWVKMRKGVVCAARGEKKASNSQATPGFRPPVAYVRTESELQCGTTVGASKGNRAVPDSPLCTVGYQPVLNRYETYQPAIPKSTDFRHIFG
jgi:hypothetical protein